MDVWVITHQIQSCKWYLASTTPATWGYISDAIRFTSEKEANESMKKITSVRSFPNLTVEKLFSDHVKSEDNVEAYDRAMQGI